MPGIFLSYRREDAAGHAGRLYDRLKRHFGQKSVFRDKELIQAGGDFSKILHHQLSGADVVLAVIGHRWLEAFSQRAANPSGAGDWVLTELRMALDWRIPIIPILVDGAPMPPEEELPTELRPLANLQAHSLEDSEQSINAFVRGLPKAVPTLPQKRSWQLRLGATLGQFRISVGASLIIGSLAVFLIVRGQIAERPLDIPTNATAPSPAPSVSPRPSSEPSVTPLPPSDSPLRGSRGQSPAATAPRRPDGVAAPAPSSAPTPAPGDSPLLPGVTMLNSGSAELRKAWVECGRDADACRSLARNDAVPGGGRRFDPAELGRTTAALGNSCSFNERDCYFAGLAHRYGIGTPIDPREAEAMFKYGCEAGDPDACRALGEKER
jgi:hypothetical protein